ncbi:hypothetical protein ACFRIC_09300 [Streptomyces sp. NPDC056738]|uniref:hypothetical protein n=1 Tax=Streptomyces sp. NPDC056738 TaxID=3345933 RepID=UPI0036A8E955
MTTRSKAKDEAEVEAPEPAPKVEAAPAPVCGAPHFLPALPHVTCTEPPDDPDLPPGRLGHEHRHLDGDALYSWR